MKYIVKQQDLKGDIKDFPIEVVQKMVDEQVKQGNKADVSVFQKNKIDGFVWSNTKQGFLFWNDVVYNKNFYTFFNNYPKTTTDKVIKPNVFVYYRGDEERSEEIIKELEKLGAKRGSWFCDGISCLYYINSEGFIDYTNKEFDNYDFIINNYTEAFLPVK